MKTLTSHDYKTLLSKRDRLASKWSGGMTAPEYQILLAKEFTQKEWESYQEKHPKTEAKDHTILKPDDKDSGKEVQSPEQAMKSWFSGLKKSTQEKLKGASESTQKFFGDKEFRNETLKGAANSLKPKAVYKKIKHHFAHEAELVGSGVKKVLKGQKPSTAEAKAIAVLALEATTFFLALSTGGVALAGAKVGTSVLKHTALSVANPLLGDLYALNHLSHMIHLAGEGEKAKKTDWSDDEALNVLLNAIHKKLKAKLEKGLSDDELTQILEGELDELVTPQSGEGKDAS